jgi:hypothetical protein
MPPLGPIMAVLLGCSGLLPRTALRSDDGTAELAIPWTFTRMELDEDAILECGSDIEGAYVLVARTPEVDLDDAYDLRRYADDLHAEQLGRMDGSAGGPAVARTVGTADAIEFVSTGTGDGVPLTTLEVVVDGAQSRFHLVAWSPTSAWPQNEGALRAIVDSFRERDALPVPATSRRPYSVHRGVAPVSVELPDDWVPPDGEARRGTFYRDPRSGSSAALVSTPADDGVPLAAFALGARAAITEEWTGATATDLVDRKIDGHEATTCEVRGSLDGYRLVGVFTAVKIDGWFHVVLAWTLPSVWDRDRDLLAHVADSLRRVPADAAPPR